MLRLLAVLFRSLNRHVAWHRLPTPLAVLNLVALREDLRRWNLHDTGGGPTPEPAQRPPRDARSADGSFTDPTDPAMGRAMTRFGRNAPPMADGAEPDVLDPNPRLVSRRLLARDVFRPAPHLSLIVPAWLQFMVHDWFAHEANVRPDDESRPEALRRPFELPLADDDDWPERPMQVRRTPPDGDGRPPAFLNTETHWWDASQIYGSSAERVRRVRTDPASDRLAPDGKIHLVDGHLPRETVGADIGRPAEVELAGVNGNWWIGLSAMHTVFAREHNHLCDALKAAYPEPARDPDWLYGKARLIVAAVLAKIHTVEWTPAVLPTPALRFAMRGNWWGMLGEGFERRFGRLVRSELLSGIPGSRLDHHAAPYAITEEFAAVYRMHALLPDTLPLRHQADGGTLADLGLAEVSGSRTHAIYDRATLADVLYSLGTSSPGLPVLHNHPAALRRLDKQAPSTRTVDVAAIDVLRDRERGVPRYCAFRRVLRMPVPRTFLDLTGGDRDTAAELEAVYGTLEKVDLLVGCAAEPWPEGFAFSDTAFRIFVLMASRRLKSDRFFTTDFTDAVYTSLGMQWIREATMRSVLLRHAPALAPYLPPGRSPFGHWRP